jgi:tetratricopeptide (TPR) repeat protein
MMTIPALPFRIGTALLLMGLLSASGRAQTGVPSRTMQLLHQRMETLDSYTQELTDLLSRLRSGQRVKPTELAQLERRFEPGPLDAVDLVLDDIYRLERLVERLRIKGFTSNPVASASRGASSGPGDQDPAAALANTPRPKPPVDETPEPVFMSKPSIETDWVKMGDSFFSLGDYRQALRAYENVKEEGASPRVLYQVALCYERMDQYPSAQRVYQKVVERFPETYWGKQSIWALDYVSWKQELESLDRKPAKAREGQK